MALEEWYSEEDFAADVVASKIAVGKNTYLRLDGRVIEYADPDIGVFLITITSAEITTTDGSAA